MKECINAIKAKPPKVKMYSPVRKAMGEEAVKTYGMINNNSKIIVWKIFEVPINKDLIR